MARIRTFVAVEIPSNVRQQATQLIERLRQAGGNVKWVEPPNLHFTLNFLGEVDEREVNDVCTVVAQAAGKIDPFEMHCMGVGAFPNVARPRTIWLGVDEGSEAMCRLQDAIATALVPLGFRKEKRAFLPHLTLGRVRRGGPELRALSQRIKEHAEYDAGVAAVEEAVVFSSRLESTGPIYQAMSRAELGNAL